MSDQNDIERESPGEHNEPSLSNPFDEQGAAEDDKPVIELSPSRAAKLGVMFGLVMVGLLLICFLLSAALASCTGGELL
jgi:hypothetical protein